MGKHLHIYRGSIGIMAAVLYIFVSEVIISAETLPDFSAPSYCCLQLQPASAAETRLEARGLYAALFLVKNRSNLAQKAICLLKLPEGWKASPSRQEVSLQPEEEKLLCFSYTVPMEAAAKGYAIACLLFPSGEEAVENFSPQDGFNRNVPQFENCVQAGYQVTIAEKPGVSIRTLSGNSLLLAGGEATLEYLVYNEGNFPETVALGIASGTACTCVLSDKKLFLQPGEAAVVACTITASQDLTEMQKTTITLTAEAEGYPATVKAVKHTLEILPLSPDRDPRRYFPVSCSFLLQSFQLQDFLPLRSSFPEMDVKLSGDGYLDAAGVHQVSLSLPFQVRLATVLQETPQFSAIKLDAANWAATYSYNQQALKLSCGTGNYSLSIPGERTIPGLGILVYYPRQQNSFEGYLAWTPETMGSNAQAGCKVYQNFAGAASVSATLVLPLQNWEDALFSLKADIQTYGTIHVLSEVTFNPAYPSAFSTSFSMDEQRSKGVYQAAFAYTSPLFSEDGKELCSFGADAVWNLLPGLELSGEFEEKKTSAVSGESASDTTINQYLHGKLLGVIGLRGEWYCSYQVSNTWNSGGDLALFSREESLALSVTAGFSSFQATAVCKKESQYRSNDELQDSVSFYPFLLTACWNITPKLSCKGSYELLPGGAVSYSDEQGMLLQKETFLGLAYQISNEASVDLQFREVVSPGPVPVLSRTVTYGCSFTKEEWGSVTLHSTLALQKLTGSLPHCSLTIGYELPVNIPLGYRAHTGSLEGTACMAETGMPLAGVVFKVGDKTAVTDKNGRFYISSLSDGLQKVEVLYTDPEQKQTQNVTSAEQLPIMVEILAGKVNRISVPFVTPAAVTGRVVLVQREDTLPGIQETPSLLQEEGVKGVLIELKSIPGSMPDGTLGITESGIVIRRAITDSQGYFHIGNVSPGQWALSLVEQSLPEDFAFECSHGEFVLKPGEELLWKTRVLPVYRAIQFVQEEILEL